MFKKIHRIGAVLAAALAVCAMPVFAQTAQPQPACYPSEVAGTGTLTTVRLLDTGIVACWACPNGQFVTIGGDAAQSLSNLGSRMDTIKNSTDKLAAARASWSRNVRYDINTAPEFARMRQELRFRQMCGWRPLPAPAASAASQ